MTNTVSFPGLGLEFEISATLLNIGGIRIQWYGFLIATGLVLALLFTYRKSKVFGIDMDKLIDVVFFSVLAGLVGARLYYVIFAFDEFAADPMKIFRIWDGGLAIYGGIIGALLVGVWLCKYKKIAVKPTLDVVALGFLIGQGIGRWGNFTNQEAFGCNTTLPWGMTSQNVVSYLTAHRVELAQQGISVDPSMPVHPCFLYESIWCLLGFFLLWRYISKRRFDGEIFFMYLAWYGAERFVVEGLRTDSLMIGSFRISQVLALVCVIVATFLIIRKRRELKRDQVEFQSNLYVNSPQWQQELEEIKKREMNEKKRKEKHEDGSSDN